MLAILLFAAAALRVSLTGHASTCTLAREIAYQCVHVRKWPVALHGSPPLFLPARLDPSATRALRHPLIVVDGEHVEALVVVDGGGGRTTRAARVVVVVGADPSVARRLAARRGSSSAGTVHFFRAPMVAAPFSAGRTPRGDATALARRVLDALLF